MVILGAGALGGALGAGFADAGAEVTLIGHAQHVEAIRARGLVVDGVRGHRVVRSVPVTSDPAGIRAADVLMLCTKGAS